MTETERIAALTYIDSKIMEWSRVIENPMSSRNDRHLAGASQMVLRRQRLNLQFAICDR